MPSFSSRIRRTRLALSIALSPLVGCGGAGNQAYVLEPLILPEKGAGASHLLLTRTYKTRILEALPK